MSEHIKKNMKKNLTLVLAAPRGFCAGVDRAIEMVEMAIKKWGRPIYVRHEIVHNKYVVNDLKKKVQYLLKMLPIARRIVR